jgi:hypothetical protein
LDLDPGETTRSSASEEREGPMSSDPRSDDEQLEVDDGTLSEVVQRPIRTAGDLSEAADASPGITTEDLARDLEAVASKPGVPTERELLQQILWRLERIEEQLEKGVPQVPPSRERRSFEDMLSELRESVRRIERKIHSSSVRRDIHGQGPVLPAKSPTDPQRIGPGVPPPQLLEQDRPSESKT